MIDSLRAHHFLCITTYQGKGYSPEFVANMNRVWSHARTAMVGEVRATAEADPICRACPHLRERADPVSCRYQSSIGARDRRMIQAMGWEENQQVSFEDVMEVVHARHKDLMEQVCTGCDWVPICAQQRFTLRDPAFVLPVEPATAPVSSGTSAAPGP